MGQILEELGIKNTEELNTVLGLLEQKQMEILERLDNVTDEERREQLENMLRKVEKTLFNLKIVWKEKNSGIKRDRENFEHLKGKKETKRKEIKYERMELSLDDAVGLLGTTEYQRGVEAIHKLAQEGYVEAQLTLGNMYYDGKRVIKDKKIAFEWYEKAAEQENEYAIYYLNQMCARDEIDNIKKVEWWHAREAKDARDEKALWGLGKAYAYGAGVERDCQLAEVYLERAASMWKDFRFELGKMYEFGRGLEQSYEKAISWYEKSEDIAAKYYLARIYCKGLGGEINSDKGKEYYEEVLKMGEKKRCNRGYVREGDEPILYLLGRMYRLGEGVEKDYVTAIKYYSEEYNYGDSSYELGKIYNNRAALEEEMKRKEQLLDEHNEKMEMIRDPNLSEAIKKQLIKESQSKGSTLFGQYTDAVNFYEHSDERAQEYFQQALEKYKNNVKYGEINAMYKLSIMYFCGHGVEQDLETAKEYCQCAVEKYDTQAISFMKVLNFCQQNKAVIPLVVEALNED